MTASLLQQSNASITLALIKNPHGPGYLANELSHDGSSTGHSIVPRSRAEWRVYAKELGYKLQEIAPEVRRQKKAVRSLNRKISYGTPINS